MYKVNFSNRAVEDLNNIWNYTAKRWSVTQADLYYNILISYCKGIGMNPVLFSTKHSEIKKDLLGCKVKKHICILPNS